MKRYTVFGTWVQPDFTVLRVVGGRAVLANLDNAHQFAGVIAVNRLGDMFTAFSILFDKNGEASLHHGSLKDDTLIFQKKYASRADIIHYTAHLKPDGLWHGTFRGDAVGKGYVKLVLHELPSQFYIDEIHTEEKQQKTEH